MGIATLAWLWCSVWAHEAPSERLHRLEEHASGATQTILERFDLAEAAFRASKLQRSAQLVNGLLREDEAPLDVYWLHGQILQQSGDLQGAKASYARYLSVGGTRPNGRRLYASVLAETGAIEAAGVEYQKSAQETGNPNDFLRAARLAMQNAQPELAAARLEVGLRQIGPAVSLREEWVRVRFADGHAEPALLEIEALLKLAPKHQGWLALRNEISNSQTGTP